SEGNTITIPMPYGLGAFVNLGYVLHDLQTGAMRPLQAARFMLESVALHFSPLGSTENVLAFISPTLADPLVTTSTGRRLDGLPLYPESFDQTKPMSQRYWHSTEGTVFEKFTTWLNEVTGGSAVRPGLIDISPEQLRYWLTFTTGGAGGFVRDVVDSLVLMH